MTKLWGPDNITATILHDYADELVPICNSSYSVNHIHLEHCHRTTEKKQQYKKQKGSKSSPENYRPASLTCISCKILEYTVLSHVSKQLAANNITIDNQHGFREKRLYETQLIDEYKIGLNVSTVVARLTCYYLTSAKHLTKCPSKISC